MEDRSTRAIDPQRKLTVAIPPYRATGLEESAGQLKKTPDFPGREIISWPAEARSASTKRNQRGDNSLTHTPSQRQPLKQPHSPTMSSELDGLCCPLTLEVFEDPTTLVGDGHTYERASIQAWLDSGKLTSPTTGATLGLGGTRLVPNYAVKRTIAELSARGRLPPKWTSPRLPPPAAVSQVTAAAEVLTVAENRYRRRPQTTRASQRISEGGHGFADKTTARQGRQDGFSEGGNSAKQKGLLRGPPGLLRSQPNCAGRREVRHGQGRRLEQGQDVCRPVPGEWPRRQRQEPVLLRGFGTHLVRLGQEEGTKAGPRGRALTEVKQEESSDDEEPLEHACDALLVGGALGAAALWPRTGSSGRSPPTARADPCIIL